MFGLFGSSNFRDPDLGSFARKSGAWRATIGLPGADAAPLILSGSRSAPHPEALQLARELPHRYSGLRPAIETELFSHFGPYRDAVLAGEPAAGPLDVRKIGKSQDVWSYVRLVHVSIEPLAGEQTVELAYETQWDEEHTLGARFQKWSLIELCGSI